MHTVSGTGIIAALASDHDETRDGNLASASLQTDRSDRQQVIHGS
jgi:hypothetical protein